MREPTFNCFNAIMLVVSAALLSGCVAGSGAGYIRKSSLEMYEKKSPMETYSQQVAEAEKRKSPLVITAIRTSEPNSVGGVDAYVDFLAVGTTAIKYATFTATPYNAVSDPVASEIGGKTRVSLEVTGPYYRGATNTGKYWKNVWYNSTIVCAAIEKVVVILMDGTTLTYVGEELGDVLANGYVNHCGNNAVATALNTAKEPVESPKRSGSNEVNDVSAALDKTVGFPPISSLPDNAGGVSLDAPLVAGNGNVVPVTINLDSPLLPGDVLVVTGDGEKAIELRTESNPVTMISTRLRLSAGKVSAYVVRTGGQINSGTQIIDIGVPASLPDSSGDNGLEFKLRATANEVKMLFRNRMATSGHIRNVVINASSGGAILVQFTPRLSINPYLGIKAENYLGQVTVSPSL